MKLPARQASVHPEPAAPFYCIAGPTSVGKSAFAITLAEELGGEIIGTDAFQIYRGLPILTAQPSPEQQRRVGHHLIGAVDPELTYSAADYARDCRAAIAEVTERRHIPILVGGTGLYFRAAMGKLSDTPEPPPELRAELAALGLSALLDRLQAADPEALPLVDTSNPRRVQRAIEICETTGLPLSEIRRRTPPGIDAPGVLLTRDRDALHRRIDKSVRAMFENGVIDEVRALSGVGPTASKAIGYREIQSHLAGEMSEAECLQRIQLRTRQYAKRQLTWFRGQTTYPTINLSEFSTLSNALDSAAELLGIS